MTEFNIRAYDQSNIEIPVAKDRFGKQLYVGDIIALPQRQSSSLWMNHYEVIETYKPSRHGEKRMLAKIVSSRRGAVNTYVYLSLYKIHRDGLLSSHTAIQQAV
jgi:hypothetical protein